MLSKSYDPFLTLIISSANCHCQTWLEGGGECFHSSFQWRCCVRHHSGCTPSCPQVSRNRKLKSPPSMASMVALWGMLSVEVPTTLTWRPRMVLKTLVFPTPPSPTNRASMHLAWSGMCNFMIGCSCFSKRTKNEREAHRNKMKTTDIYWQFVHSRVKHERHWLIGGLNFSMSRLLWVAVGILMGSSGWGPLGLNLWNDHHVIVQTRCHRSMLPTQKSWILGRPLEEDCLPIASCQCPVAAQAVLVVEHNVTCQLRAAILPLLVGKATRHFLHRPVIAHCKPNAAS